MKKLFIMILLAIPVAAMCQANGGYKAGYSSNFKMGDPKFSDKVLTLWKDLENNTLDKHLDFIADTVTMIPAEGGSVKGLASNLAGVKGFRASVTNYKITVDAWMSLKCIDRNEDWVAVWGTQSFTDKDGKAITQRIHEIWGFNKDGKISIIMQYAGM